MINEDYEALKTSGKHEVTFTVLGVDLDCILYTEYYWLIAYYSKGTGNNRRLQSMRIFVPHTQRWQ